MSGIPYPPKNKTVVIIFREPFPHVAYEPYKTYYINANLGNGHEVPIRMKARQQLETIDRLVLRDKKILNASVISVNGVFSILGHSPQSDFFNLVGGNH